MTRSIWSNPASTADGTRSWAPTRAIPKASVTCFRSRARHYSDPKFSWFDTVGPTGIVFFNSAQLGVEYQNNVFVGDINNGILYRFKPNAARNGFDFVTPGLADLVADNAAELTS